MKIKNLIITFICTFCLITLPAQVKAQYYENVADIMESLSINLCFDTKDKDVMVSRGEFVASVVNLLNMQAYGKDGSFNDIGESVYKNEIYTAALNGIVGEAEKFRPDDVVTYAEAITMIINAIGYKETALFSGGYPNGYITLAESLGITDGINFIMNDKVSAENAVMLLFNAGNTNIYKQNNNSTVYKEEMGDSVFYEYHDIGYGKGILDGNSYTSITISKGLGDNCVSINGEIFELYYNSAVTEKLGNYVEYYYKTNSDDSKVILFIGDFKNKNEITTISLEDVLSYNNGVLRYYDGRNKTETIPMDTPIIYNSVMTLKYFLDDGSSIFEQENGEIVLVDNNSDGKIDVVRITAYDNYFVSFINETEGIIYDKYDNRKKIDFTEIDGKKQKLWIITDIEGNLIDVADIRKNDVISTAKSLNGDVLRAVVSRNSIAGSVSAERADGEHVFITVDGVEYRLSSSRNSSIVKVGNVGKFYLDYLGNIAGVEFDNTKNSYGFLISTSYNSDDEEFRVKILGQDGVLHKALKLAKKGIIDGVHYDTWQEVETLLELSEGYEKLHYPSKVIVYRLNNAGELNYIDTQKPNGTDKYSLRTISENTTSALYNSGGNSLDNVIYVGSAVIFITPEKTDAEGNINPAIYDDTKYVLGTVEDLKAGRNYGISAFSTNPESVLPECIQTTRSAGSNTIATGSPHMLVTQVYWGLNDDAVPAMMIEGWHDNIFVKVPVSESYSADLDFADIVEGDFIKYTENGIGEMTSAMKIFDYQTKEEGPFRTTVTSGWLDFASGFHMDIGTLYSVENKVAVLKDSVLYGPEADYGPFDPYYTLYDRTKKFIVKKGRGGKTEIEDVSANLEKVKDQFHHNENNKALLITTYSNVWMMVVYE